MKRLTRDSPMIGLRITDPQLQERVEALAKEQGLSVNMTLNMLLGYAFNTIEKTGNTFTAKMVFEESDS